ncbi:MAG: serine hydrolase domain-containing protein [Clostridium sp.]
MDKWIKEEFNKFSGSILVTKGEETIINSGFGLGDELNKINNASNTRFMIGSISKMFTAVAIMKLYEEKKLDINDSASKYLNIKGLDTDIKIVNLLNHTSGLKNYVMCNKRFNLYDENDPLIIAKDICSMKRDFKVGKKLSYNNTGYLILALIIENISKIKFEEYIENNILVPLNMNDSEFLSRSNKERAIGYKKGKVQGIFHHSAFFGCGDIISTTGDLKKFILAFNGGKIVRKDLVEKMKEISAKNKLMRYGYGCMITELAGGKGFGHGGSVPNSFSSQISHYNNCDITIIVLCNDIRSVKNCVPGVLITQYMERCIYEKLTLTKLSYINKIIF